MTLKSPIARILAGILFFVVGLLAGWLATPLMFEEGPAIKLLGLALFLPAAALVLIAPAVAFGDER